MQKITSININAGVHAAAIVTADEEGIKGGFSGLVETLLRKYLKEQNVDWKKLKAEKQA